MSEYPHAIIVIGASAGGLDALRTIVAGLDADLDAAIFVVMHIGAHKSELPKLLSHIGSHHAVHPRDGDEIRPGGIFVAPPDHHMILKDGLIRLTKGPRENWARPAVDPLFRSAAEAYGARVIGVILSGGLNDGVAGLYEIKQRGGLSVVQDPADAINPGMPTSALAHVEVDHCLPAGEMPRLLSDLVAAVVSNAPAGIEAAVALPEEEGMTDYTHARPIAVTCPDCGGALRRQERGSLTQFRCHIGHVYTAQIMLAAQFLAMEQSLGAAMRSLRERAELCRQMSEKTSSPGGDAQAWEIAMNEASDQAVEVERLLEREWTLPDGRGSIEISHP